ncbi:toxin [Streptomyces sp. 5-8]|uniref:Toxin n=2 Tax=Streptomyces TaxID=1883 RepID=A0ABS1NT89_9ACTN|nr:toxin [Streptomyces musisoli]MBL1103087.1 toxin [Streptomyces musisoli]
MTALIRLRQWQRLRRRDKEMRQFAETLIAPVRERLSGAGADDDLAALTDPEALFAALVESARQWRGERRLEVHKVHIPREFKATGMWLERADRDDVIIEQDAEVWHQAQIFGHELWHMRQKDGFTPEQLASGAWEALESGHVHGDRPAAARSRFDEDPEKEAELFGIRVGQEMRALMERDVITGETARRIADALNYRGNRR